MVKRFHKLLCLFVLLPVIFTSCGGSSSGDAGTDNGTEYGGGIGSTYDVTDITCEGPTSIDVSNGAFSIFSTSVDMCANATSPTLSSDASIPDAEALGLDADSVADSDDVNVTDNGATYTAVIGERPFYTPETNGVSITVPFDSSAIDPSDRNSTHIFLRVLDNSDNSTAEVAGTVNEDNTLTVSASGLPASFTAAVVYNPNMDDVEDEDQEVDASVFKTPIWGASRWCVVYNKKQVASVLGISQASVPAYLRSGILPDVALAARTYRGIDMRSPYLDSTHSASEPCGGVLGTTNRYNIHLIQGNSKYQANMKQETAGPLGLRFGRVMIDMNALAWTYEDDGATLLNVVAHELLHAIQMRYLMTGIITSRGYTEGSSQCYGESFDYQRYMGLATMTPVAREGYRQRLSDFLMINSATPGADVDNTAYMNQDFFVYVARQYGGGSFAYFTDLYQQIYDTITELAASVSDAIAAVIRYMPPRAHLFSAMDTSFRNTLDGAPTLKGIYLDFLRQRAMEHNAASQMHEDDINSGFDSDLFQHDDNDPANSALIEQNLDPEDVAASWRSTFVLIPPYAARAIWIKPTRALSAGSTGAELAVKITPVSGTVGSTIDGAAYQNGTFHELASTNTFSDFGLSADDAIVVIVANTPTELTEYSTKSVRIEITGQSGSDSGGGGDGDDGGGGGGGGGDDDGGDDDGGDTHANTFSITNWTIPSEAQMTPVYALLPADIAGSMMLDAVISSVAATEDQSIHPYIQIHIDLHQVTAAGTYIAGMGMLDSPTVIAYINAETGAIYESEDGSTTFDVFDSNADGKVTGSFESVLTQLPQ